MRLGIDLSCLSESWSGVQMYTYAFTKTLLRASSIPLDLYGHGHDLPVGLQLGPRDEWKPGPGLRSRVFQEQVVLPQRVRGRSDRLLIPAYLGPVVVSCPVDLIVHDLLFLDPRAGHSLKQAVYWKGLVRPALARADRLFPCSEFTRTQIQRRFPRLATKLGPTLYPGLRSFADGSERGWDQPVETGDRFILSVGTVSPRKRVQSLVESYLAAPSTLRNQFDLRLVGAYGWGPSHPRKWHDPGKGIYWHGSVPDAELARLYRRASLLVLPSEGEGFGMPILEAFAHRLPVLLRDIPVFREVAGKAAFYFSDPADTGWSSELERALTETARRREVVTRGVRRLPRYRWCRTVNRYLRSIA